MFEHLTIPSELIPADGRFGCGPSLVRPEFVEKIKQSEHWQHQQMVPNVLREGTDIWS